MKTEDYGISKDTFQLITGYIDEVKDLLSSEIWENIFMDLTKNEMLIFWLLYLKKEVNMTEIAEYIHVPLNTATGIVSRMEKNGFIDRTRSAEDKRVVLIVFSEKGKNHFMKLFKKMTYYGTRVFESFSEEEIKLFMKMADKVKTILREDALAEAESGKQNKKVRKITID